MYLVLITVPESEEAVIDGVLQTAASFLGIVGAMERREVGRYVRGGRADKESDVLRLVEFVATGDDPAEGPRARRLEGVLRQTLATTAAKTSDVRVFVSSA